MSVYIPGMEMPTEGTVIAIYKRGGKFYASMHRGELCPLVPVPDHGRLIDADAVTNAAMENILMWEDAGCDRDDYRAFLDNYIADAPTIIPADPADKEDA